MRRSSSRPYPNFFLRKGVEPQTLEQAELVGSRPLPIKISVAKLSNSIPLRIPHVLFYGSAQPMSEACSAPIFLLGQKGPRGIELSSLGGWWLTISPREAFRKRRLWRRSKAQQAMVSRDPGKCRYYQCPRKYLKCL